MRMAMGGGHGSSRPAPDAQTCRTHAPCGAARWPWCRPRPTAASAPAAAGRRPPACPRACVRACVCALMCEFSCMCARTCLHAGRDAQGRVGAAAAQATHSPKKAHTHLLGRGVLQATRRVRLDQRVPAGRAADELQAVHSPPGRPALQVPQHGRVGRGRLRKRMKQVTQACECEPCFKVQQHGRVGRGCLRERMKQVTQAFSHAHIHVPWCRSTGELATAVCKRSTEHGLQRMGVSTRAQARKLKHAGMSTRARALLGAPAQCSGRALLPRQQKEARTAGIQARALL